MESAVTLNLIDAKILGVLGEYDHHIPFAAEDDSIIVYGPNGVGKTKTLEVINAVCRFDGRALSRIPFKSARLRFTESYRIDVSFVDDPEIVEQGQIRFRAYKNRKKVFDWIFVESDSTEWINEHTPWMQIDEDLWRHSHSGEMATLSELETRYASRVRSPHGTAPDELLDLRRRMSSILIETQRLRALLFENSKNRTTAIRRRRMPNKSRISAQAVEMLGLIDEAQTAHSRLTQERDRTFPSRVLRDSAIGAYASETAISEQEIREKYEDQNEFRARLARVVSVPPTDDLSLPSKAIEPWVIRLLDLYLRDASDKLEPFKLLLRKIELLEDIVNRRLLKKRIEINSSKGMVVVTDDNREIPLEALSSGEQHEIILMFDLLFTVSDGALVLIDEPEISLHVAWQVKFMPDVRRIAELRGLRFIVATHSPQIINGDWNCAISLSPEGAEFE
ncbi:AAA family ATPase [Gordonia malaquae]|uniref:AAA family ATPase n=1 Tax=Gordonia malaquae TaxID=410332 RepID=UPI0030FEF5D5